MILIYLLTEANAQQAAQVCWFFTGVTAPVSLQSTCLGNLTFALGMKVVGVEVGLTIFSVGFVLPKPFKSSLNSWWSISANPLIFCTKDDFPKP